MSTPSGGRSGEDSNEMFYFASGKFPPSEGVNLPLVTITDGVLRLQGFPIDHIRKIVGAVPRESNGLELAVIDVCRWRPENPDDICVSELKSCPSRITPTRRVLIISYMTSLITSSSPARPPLSQRLPRILGPVVRKPFPIATEAPNLESNRYRKKTRRGIYE
jgi:hypothetical protein